MKASARNVAIGSILMVTVSIGSYTTLPVYLVPLTKALNVSIGQVVLLFSIAAIGQLLTSLLMGQLLRAIKVKLLVALSGITFAVLFVCIYMAKSITLIYIGAIFFGFATIVGGFAMAQTLITWWFAKGAAKLMSLLLVGMSIFGLIFAPIIAKLVVLYGLQIVALYQGIIVGAVMVLCGLFLVAQHPSTYGLKPSGYEEGQNNAESPGQPQKSLTFKQIMGTSQFWLLMFAACFATMAMTGFTNNASAFYQSIGLDAVGAAFCIAIFSAAAILWTPLYGILVDKSGVGFATTLIGGVGAIMFFGASILTGFIGAVFIAILLSTMNFSGMVGPISLTKLFGTKEAGNLVGFATAASSVGAMLGAPIAGFIYDATKSYKGFLLVAGIAVILVIISVATSMSKKSVKKIGALELKS